MERITSENYKEWKEYPFVPLEKPFVDGRGVIQNLVEEMMGSAVIIHSKKGALRANHYHKTDWHYCYVLSGSIEYYYRPCGSKEMPTCVIAKKGQMIFTPPMVEHAMKFSEDSDFITLSKNARDHENYEADVVRIPLVSV